VDGELGTQRCKIRMAHITCIIILVLCFSSSAFATTQRLTFTPAIAKQSDLFILDVDINNLLCNKYHISLSIDNPKYIFDFPDEMNDVLERDSKLSEVNAIIQNCVDDENKIINGESFLFNLNIGEQLVERNVIKLE
jgi:hypothetical protein